MRSVSTVLLLSALGLFPSLPARGQGSSTAVLPGAGLAFEYGLGSSAVTDEYFSSEKYSGSLPLVHVSWTRAHERAVYRLGLEARTSSRLRNYSVATAITQVTFHQGFLYPLHARTLLGRDLHLFLGPCTEFFVLVNSQDLAVSALGFGASVTVLLALGIHGEAVLPLSEKIELTGFVRAGLLSFGMRAIDDETNDDAGAPKILTGLAGTHTTLRFGLGYRLSNAFRLSGGYQFSLTRITPWTPLLAASDTALFGLSWSF